MPQIHTIGRANTTTALHPDGSKSVTLYQTEVIRYNPAKHRVSFNTGGYFTTTTRNRMNQACNQWGIPLSVSFAGGECIVRNHVSGAIHLFKGNECKVSV